MARTLYAGRPGDTVVSLFGIGSRKVLALPVDGNGDPARVFLEVFDAPAGTQLTDLLAADGVTAITGVLTTLDGQIPAFYGPDGVDVDVWLRDPEGDFTRLDVGLQGPKGEPGTDGLNGSGTVNTVNGDPGPDVFTATTAQGATADSAVQPEDLSTVATTGTYGDLAGKPTLGTAAAKNTGTTSGTVPLLGTGGRLDIARIASGTPDGTKFVNDAGVLATPAGGGGTADLAPPVYYQPSSASTYTTGSTALSGVDVDPTNLKLTVVIPASGSIWVYLEALVAPPLGESYNWLLREGSSPVPNTSRRILRTGANPGQARVGTWILIQGLVPGSTHTYKWAHYVAAGSGIMQAESGSAGPAIMRVQAA